MTRFMLALIASLVLWWPSIAAADPPPPPATWQPLTPVFGCEVDTEEEPGYCRLFVNTADGTNYLVFFDEPGRVKWIRFGTNGDYTYWWVRRDDVPI